ncbi:enhancer of split mbeta protein [Lepeophtheirus salmonis]|uniref:enhancer of split mbeta protein n=1 Tax=Lepeophtheirus salmonis TaxID=72036 RepID=UPI00077F7C8A|nr:enhancer of split mgamma protein-like [Lepeophtheirus salmonis]
MPAVCDDISKSKSFEYRKVMKPLLERKRRARINRCLDDLRDLMVEALQAEGESITKLEKADVLEYTVRHLRKLGRQDLISKNNPSVHTDRYVAGYSACAKEVSQFLSSTPGADLEMGSELMSHLGSSMSNNLIKPLSVNTSHSLNHRESSPSPSDSGYHSPGTLTPPMQIPIYDVSVVSVKTENVWRPF